MITRKNEGWATFDTPWQVQPSQQDIIGSSGPSSLMSLHGGVHENNNQSWSSFEESTTPFDPFLPWGIPEIKEADIKSCNPFDLPSDADFESSNMLFDMSSSSWFSESAAIPFTPDALVYMAGQAPSMQISPYPLV